MALLLEKLYPALLGILAFFVNPWYWSCWRLPSNLGELMSMSVNVAAITLGFLASANAIMLSLEDRPVAKSLKTVKQDGQTYWNILCSYLSAAIRWSFLLAAISVAGRLAPLDPTECWTRYLFFAWIAILVAAGTSCIRIARLLATILAEPR